MNPFRRVSIRNKLLGIILLTALVSLICGFGFVLLNDVRTFKRDLAEQATLIARIAADYSVSDLAFGDQEASSRTLRKLATIPGLEAAYLFDTEGKLFSS